jgi:hypothetical protein
MMPNTEKIAPQHLARPAVVYVRQSTVGQVRHHHESRRRQYDLAVHAKQLGWREVSVIDEDLGARAPAAWPEQASSTLSPKWDWDTSARFSRSRCRA